MKMAVVGENAACNVHLICCCNNNAAAIFHSFQWGRFFFCVLPILCCSFYANFATLPLCNLQVVKERTMTTQLPGWHWFFQEDDSRQKEKVSSVREWKQCEVINLYWRRGIYWKLKKWEKPPCSQVIQQFYLSSFSTFIGCANFLRQIKTCSPKS